MRVERVVHYTPAEALQLRALREIANTEHAIRAVRIKLVQDAVSAGLGTRRVAAAVGWSPTQVSRLAPSRRRVEL